MQTLEPEQRKVLDVAADEHARTGGVATGKRIRHALSAIPRDRVNAVLDSLVPRFLERITLGRQDSYYLTLDGWLHSHRTTEASKMLESCVAMLRKKFNADPDFREYTWEEVKAASGLGDDSFHLANLVLRAANLWGSGGSSPGNPPDTSPRFNYSQPLDIEEVLDCETIEDIVSRSTRRAREASGIDVPADAPLATHDWDVFICHASEDKASFVQDLATALSAQGVRVWYDASTLTLGDSLRRKIDEGLSRSKFGVVVLSKAFFSKRWPQRELDGLVQREMGVGDKVILPIWHGVSREEVMRFSLTLADKLAIASDEGLEEVVRRILEVLRPSSAAESGGARPPRAVAARYTKTVRANFQGQATVRKGHDLELKSWIGPGGPLGGGTLRVLEMRDVTDDVSYESDVARLTMTVQPTRVPLHARVAGEIAHQNGVVTFMIEFTEEEYARFVPHVEAAPSAFVS